MKVKYWNISHKVFKNIFNYNRFRILHIYNNHINELSGNLQQRREQIKYNSCPKITPYFIHQESK